MGMEMGGAVRDLMEWVMCSVVWICLHQHDFGFSRFGETKFIAFSQFVFGPFDLKMVDSRRSLPLFGTLLGSSLAFSTCCVLYFMFWWYAPWFCVQQRRKTW